MAWFTIQTEESSIAAMASKMLSTTGGWFPAWRMITTVHRTRLLNVYTRGKWKCPISRGSTRFVWPCGKGLNGPYSLCSEYLFSLWGYTGILKGEFLIDTNFRSFQQAGTTIKNAINIYNYERPHMSLGYSTPSEVHFAGLLKEKLSAWVLCYGKLKNSLTAINSGWILIHSEI